MTTLTNKLNRFIFFIGLLICFLACETKPENVFKQNKSVEQLIKSLKNADSDRVIVVAHRGDWRNAPENSLQAIQNSIDMGVDVVEIDVRLSKDSVPLLMHDNTLNRTTNGNGKISDWTLDSLKTLYLRNGLGRTTFHKIPTLKEALSLAKGKVLINVDKCYGYFNEVYQIIKEIGTEDQVIIKAYNKTYEEVKSDLGALLDSIIFMPIINLDRQPNAWKIIQDFQQVKKPVAFEIVFSSDTSQVLSKFKEIKKNGSRVWVNSLWSSLNAGYDDDAAVKNLDSIYSWHINKGFNMIQTDRPQLLLEYLREKGLHD